MPEHPVNLFTRHLQRQATLDSAARPLGTTEIDCLNTPSRGLGTTQEQAVQYKHGAYRYSRAALSGDPAYKPIAEGSFTSKHYQRVQYRKGLEYAKKQISLVSNQLIKLVEWSEKNRVDKSGPYIKGWSVTLRKRALEGLHDHVRGGEPMAPSYPGQLESNLVNGVPAWIIQCQGEGKTAVVIHEIVNRIRDELESGSLKEVPEIEFLPDLINSITGEPIPVRKPNKHKANKALESQLASSRTGIKSRKKYKSQNTN